ncbi:hypothetical protein H072_243 [Dactylellina haptotyla CBS 200.50]|uniref:Uncharacterized protein n=1 Tax=Dactylellina haptotyla (strain CBS 200.50) TaxID=1284197 RepID=S8AXV4_DACHA|nr:hypothetical protein H072_243 [Dactylellina haptotyla CBS 200.50]
MSRQTDYPVRPYCSENPSLYIAVNSNTHRSILSSPNLFVGSQQRDCTTNYSRRRNLETSLQETRSPTWLPRELLYGFRLDSAFYTPVSSSHERQSIWSKTFTSLHNGRDVINILRFCFMTISAFIIAMIALKHREKDKLEKRWVAIYEYNVLQLTETITELKLSLAQEASVKAKQRQHEYFRSLKEENKRTWQRLKKLQQEYEETAPKLNTKIQELTDLLEKTTEPQS